MLAETRKGIYIGYYKLLSFSFKKVRIDDSVNTGKPEDFPFLFIFQISPEPSSSQTFDHYPYLAYSPSGTVEADLVYANYGTDEDFEKLAEMNVTVTGNIVIIRSRSVSILMKFQPVLESGSRAI